MAIMKIVNPNFIYNSETCELFIIGTEHNQADELIVCKISNVTRDTPSDFKIINPNEIPQVNCIFHEYPKSKVIEVRAKELSDNFYKMTKQ